MNPGKSSGVLVLFTVDFIGRSHQVPRLHFFLRSIFLPKHPFFCDRDRREFPPSVFFVFFPPQKNDCPGFRFSKPFFSRLGKGYSVRFSLPFLFFACLGLFHLAVFSGAFALLFLIKAPPQPPPPSPPPRYKRFLMCGFFGLSRFRSQNFSPFLHEGVTTPQQSRLIVPTLGCLHHLSTLSLLITKYSKSCFPESGGTCKGPSPFSTWVTPPFLLWSVGPSFGPISFLFSLLMEDNFV